MNSTRLFVVCVGCGQLTLSAVAWCEFCERISQGGERFLDGLASTTSQDFLADMRRAKWIGSTQVEVLNGRRDEMQAITLVVPWLPVPVVHVARVGDMGSAFGYAVAALEQHARAAWLSARSRVEQRQCGLAKIAVSVQQVPR